MTSRSYSNIVCECGHRGTLCCKENDAPFTKGYEEYSMSGFEAQDRYFDGYCDDSAKLLVDMKPVCPECGAVGKVSFAK
jgi:hypothetical protein